MEPNPLEKDLEVYARVAPRTRFTISAYKYMVENVPTNWVISPFSAECFLTIIRLGARGQTAEEIKEKLGHLSCMEIITVLALGGVITNLRARTGHRLEIYAKIYVSKNYEMKQHFKDLVSACGAARKNVDFTQQCASAMNGFLLKAITDKFCEKITDDMLPADTKMALINGVSFKARWLIPFEKRSTPMQFFVNKQESVMVESMVNVWAHAYYYYDILQATIFDIDLMTTNHRDCSLVLIIPDEVDGLAQVEANIQIPLEVPIIFLREKTRIELELPIIKFETLIDFKEIFKTDGIEKVFNEDEADLTGISDTKGLHLNNFFQQTVFSLNEVGVNADAYLDNYERPPRISDIVDGMAAGRATRHIPPLCIKADRPFAFYIRVRNVIVKTGRFVKPSP